MFSELLTKLRKDKGITQKDLAELLHTTDKSVSRWEKGGSMPTLEMMYQISKVFNVPFNSLIKARVSSPEDDTTYKEIINELSEINNKRLKVFKIILIVAFILIVIMAVAIVFTNSFNRFKVYNVNVENDDFIKMTGVYVETKQKDILNLNNIKIKGVEITDKDIVSVDLYLMDDGEKVLLNNYTSLDDISFINYQRGTKYSDLSDFADSIYLNVTIFNEKGKTTEYSSRLKFALNFTNNKVIYTEDKYEENNNALDLSNEKIAKVLETNGFEKVTDTLFLKNTATYKINYFSSSNKLTIKFLKNKLNYNYTYNLENSILSVRIYNEDTTDIQNYTYDVANDKEINCIVGSCNDTKHAMKVINENFLDLFKK